MEEKFRIKFNPATSEIEVEGSEEFVKTYFMKLQKMLTREEEAFPAPGKKTPSGPPAARRGDIYAAVMAPLAASAEGLDMADLKEKTGLTTQQIRSVIYRAEKQGKVRRAGRGRYAAA